MKLTLLLIACLCWPLSVSADCQASGSGKPYLGPLFDAMAQIESGMYEIVLTKDEWLWGSTNGIVRAIKTQEQWRVRCHGSEKAISRPIRNWNA